MTDREMLEYAAKAARVELWHEDVFTNGLTQKVSENGILQWNPLTDDGDALRLAVKLNITVHPGFAYTPTGKLINYRDHANRTAATRRAITRAAAEIGKKL